MTDHWPCEQFTGRFKHGLNASVNTFAAQIGVAGFYSSLSVS